MNEKYVSFGIKHEFNNKTFVAYVEITNLQLLEKMTQLNSYSPYRYIVNPDTVVNLINKDSDFMKEVDYLIHNKALKDPPFEVNINHTLNNIPSNLKYINALNIKIKFKSSSRRILQAVDTKSFVGDLKENVPNIFSLSISECLLKTYAKQVSSLISSLSSLRVVQLYFFDSCDAIGGLCKMAKLRNLEEVVITYSSSRLYGLRNFETVKSRWTEIVKRLVRSNAKLNYFELAPDSQAKQTIIIDTVPQMCRCARILF